MYFIVNFLCANNISKEFFPMDNFHDSANNEIYTNKSLSETQTILLKRTILCKRLHSALTICNIPLLDNCEQKRYRKVSMYGKIIRWN